MLWLILPLPHDPLKQDPGKKNVTRKPVGLSFNGMVEEKAEKLRIQTMKITFSSKVVLMEDKRRKHGRAKTVHSKMMSDKDKSAKKRTCHKNP